MPVTPIEKLRLSLHNWIRECINIPSATHEEILK
jgi:poly(3-hydroxyalkanoate) synthetase